MVTIILPGFSVYNKEWLEETAKKIKVGGEIRPIYWEHWTDPNKEFDVREKGRLINNVAGIRVTDIIAKSIGTLTASYMILKSPEKINKVIFNGIPLNDLSESEKEVIKSALRLIPRKNFICFQNEADPHASFNQVNSFLSEIGEKINLVRK